MKGEVLFPILKVSSGMIAQDCNRSKIYQISQKQLKVNISMVNTPKRSLSHFVFFTGSKTLLFQMQFSPEDTVAIKNHSGGSPCL